MIWAEFVTLDSHGGQKSRVYTTTKDDVETVGGGGAIAGAK
jgi:hypothetical protein